MYCINCGQKIEDGSKLCPNCATPVQANTNNDTLLQESPKRGFYKQPKQSEPKKTKKPSLKLPLFIVVGIIVVFVFFKPDKEDNNIDEKQAEEIIKVENDKTITYSVSNEIEEYGYSIKTEKIEIFGSENSNVIGIKLSMDISNTDNEDILIVAPYRVENLTVSGKQYIEEASTMLKEEDGTSYVIPVNESQKIDIELTCELLDEYSIASFLEDDSIDLDLAVGECRVDSTPSFLATHILCNNEEPVIAEEPTTTEEAEEKEFGSQEDMYAAQDIFESYCKSKYIYGIKLHWLTGGIVSRDNGDGTYFFKVNATIKNAFNAKYDIIVEGTVDENGNVTYFNDYQ